MDMKKESYRLWMVTCGFVGSADQSGQWRTPPLKALLRMWWRIVWWNTTKKPTIPGLHEAEGRRFGSAAAGTHTQSPIRLRLASWRPGSQTQSTFSRIAFASLTHPEVPNPVKTSLYLGYGPVTYQKGHGAILTRKCAVGPNEENELRLSYPSTWTDELHATLKLVSLFGTIGGRSRNGWGSLLVTPKEPPEEDWPPTPTFFDPSGRDGRAWLDRFAKPLDKALEEDWCHAVGRDGKGFLLWCTEKLTSWEAALDQLGKVKIAFRTQFHFRDTGNQNDQLCDRLILAYPVTKHAFSRWDSRKLLHLANQILFKVLPDGDGYRGLVVHLPHGLPAPMVERLSEDEKKNLREREMDIWRKVHGVLDEHLTRLS